MCGRAEVAAGALRIIRWKNKARVAMTRLLPWRTLAEEATQGASSHLRLCSPRPSWSNSALIWKTRKGGSGRLDNFPYLSKSESLEASRKVAVAL